MCSSPHYGFFPISLTPTHLHLASAAVATLKGSCPNSRLAVLSPRCFAWSYVPAGLQLEKAPSPFGFFYLPTMKGGKYLVLCSTGCGRIKGRNQSLLVTRDRLICQNQPAQLGFPFQAGCDDSENRVDNELFMSRSCLFTLLQNCEWPVHPELWPQEGTCIRWAEKNPNLHLSKGKYIVF